MILRYTLHRLLMLIPVSFAISVVIFMIVYLLPGDPIDNLLRVGSSEADRAALVERYGLDRPLVVQYFVWIGNMFQGEFGQAIVLRRPVADLIAQNLPYSLTLGGLARETFVFRERHDGRRGARTFGVFDDARLRAVHDRDAGVGGAEVDTDYFSHVFKSLSGDWRGRTRRRHPANGWC